MALIHLQKKLIDQSRNILSDIYNQFYYYYYYQLILSSIINYSFYTGQTIYIDINIIISLVQFRYSFVVLRYSPPPHPSSFPFPPSFFLVNVIKIKYSFLSSTVASHSYSYSLNETHSLRHLRFHGKWKKEKEKKKRGRRKKERM